MHWMQERRKKSKKKSDQPRPRRDRRGDSRVRIAIIGAGRLGAALGRALGRAGYRIEVVVTRRPAQARKAARLIGPGVLSLTPGQLGRLTREQLDRLSRCDLILIATPDDVIGLAAAQFAAQLKARRRTSSDKGRVQKTALHTSGALSSEILGPLREAGFAIGSLHPLISVSDPVLGAEMLRHAFFCVEGDRPAVRRARSIVRNLHGQSFTIEACKKGLYHASAVTASGHLVALFDIALEMLTRCGLSPPRARQVLLPLVKSTMANLSTKPPVRALTGTFARGDLATVRRHLAAIESEQLRDALAAYLLLGARSIRLGQKAGASASELNKIAKLIRETARIKAFQS
jgi:predicted short-subunit dehydrogenase-like oxidoreductase (DUF2520 family)